MLSICVTVKNRSHQKTEHGLIKLFPECIRSLDNCLSLEDDVELIITDWESDDYPIRDWIESCVRDIPIHLITIKGEGFSKGKGQNIAAEHANGNILFFLDTDIILNQRVLNYGLSIPLGESYYPTIKYQTEPHGSYNLVNHEGGGIFFIHKRDFEKTGGFPEFFRYGFEDTEMVKRVGKVAPILVKDDIALFHQWHPQGMEFKDKYGTKEIEPEYNKTKNDCINAMKKLEEETKWIVRSMINDPNVQHPTRRR